MTLVIRNGRVLDPSARHDAAADVLIEEGVIKEVAAARSLDVKGAQVLDATGLLVLPGLVDLRAHLREPGEEYEEDIASGSAAAAAGGVTTLLAMPDTHPAIDNGELVDFVRRRGAEVGLCRVLVAGAITIDLKGEQLAPVGEMRRAGAVALADADRWVANGGLMRRALEYSQDFGMPVITHADDATISRQGHMHEGPLSTAMGLRGSARVAEEAALARDLVLAEYTGGRLHVAHLSTAGSVALVRAAKQRGVEVTAEVAVHHLVLTCEAVLGYRTSTKVLPPLRDEADRLALIEGVRDGTIDAIVSDHSPQGVLDKDVAFDEAAYGALGLQTLLPLALEVGRKHDVPLMTVVERLTVGPARVLGQGAGTLVKGAAADLTLVDPNATWTLTREELRSKSDNSPFLGRALQGRVETTLCGGKLVFTRRAEPGARSA